jgi:hypothetical protein
MGGASIHRAAPRMHLLANPDAGDQADQQEVKTGANGNLGALENVLAQLGLESLLPEI